MTLILLSCSLSLCVSLSVCLCLSPPTPSPWVLTYSASSCYDLSNAMESLMWQGNNLFSQQPTKTWSLLTTTWLSLEVDFLRPAHSLTNEWAWKQIFLSLNLETTVAWLTLWLLPCERPWATITQLSYTYTWISDPWKSWDNKYCCFKLLHFEVVC